MPEVHQRSQGLLRGQVDFVDYEKHLRPRFLHFLNEIRIPFGRVVHIGYIHQNIGIYQCRLTEFEHLLLQFVVGLEHAWRIRKHNLIIVCIHDAHDSVASRLRLGGDDA